MRLKDTLKDIAQQHRNGMATPPTDELIDSMLRHIGSTDPELRDELIYSIFAKWISDNGLTHQQLEYILDTCLDENHLFYEIGEKNGDSVFTRSFSSLVIACIMAKDVEDKLLSEEKTDGVFDSVIHYLHTEVDTRGFVNEKGWAHSIAHGADMLVSCINHHSFSFKNANLTLEAVARCLLIGNPLIDDEDERLVVVIKALLNKGVNSEVITSWIQNTNLKLEEVLSSEGYSIKFFRTKTTVMNFYKTLYFHLKIGGCNQSIGVEIENCIKYWYHKFNQHF
ncbi:MULTISPECIES: DUF2785 domain-containing protein [Bacillaceae]|uniref:DUF2785 domain-containing protein n=1 Tax=Evansella alkalicola TaxID=745819 RepID=A0ABS6K2I4_9BACI|nr:MULTISPECIES: DUF2785 domain-containing protein [Bacillaceae]MBU9724227.1 DUF2785 domain-containing protein [Bacillus alkalicola]